MILVSKWLLLELSKVDTQQYVFARKHVSTQHSMRIIWNVIQIRHCRYRLKIKIPSSQYQPFIFMCIHLSLWLIPYIFSWDSVYDNFIKCHESATSSVTIFDLNLKSLSAYQLTSLLARANQTLKSEFCVKIIVICHKYSANALRYCLTVILVSVTNASS